MRQFLLSLSLALAAILSTHAAEPFEIKDGDRVLFLGDTLLEREGTYGYLETRMVEQFPDRKFTVRNLAFSADTPLGWSRASFDPPAKGFERLKEQLALVKPTVVFLGYGMAASLQEMTDRSQDWTLNRDPARYGAEPMSAARFKKELAQCMDLIEEVSADSADLRRNDGTSPASENLRPSAQSADKKSAVRFVLLSPIRHEDLRATRPGLPDPTEHNKLLEQYSKAIEELAQERGARFVPLNRFPENRLIMGPLLPPGHDFNHTPRVFLTDNGIHPTEQGYMNIANGIFEMLGLIAKRQEYHWGKSADGYIGTNGPFNVPPTLADGVHQLAEPFKNPALRAAIIRKNALFFHRWRPANETYLFGFRKREQGQNAVEIPKFDPLIEAAEAEIEKLKKAPKGASLTPAGDGMVAVANGAEAENSTIFAAKCPLVDVAHSDAGDDHSDVDDKSRECGRQVQGCTPRVHESQAASAGLYPTNTDLRATSTGLRTRNRSDVNATYIAAHDANIAVHDANIAVGDAHKAVDDEYKAVNDGYIAVENNKKADIQPKTPVLTSTGQLYAANDGGKDRETGRQGDKEKEASAPAVSPSPSLPLSQSAPAPASPSTLPLPDFTLADGLEISLWAENPLLAKPTECNWDAQGRLWVASSAMYPQIAPGQEATDKIIIIEDPGHTGKATKATVFADGLLIPTGVAPVLVQDGGERAAGRAGFQPAVPGILPGTPGVAGSANPAAPAATGRERAPEGDGRNPTSDAPGRIPGAAGNIPALPEANAPARWGCYVGQSTELLYFEDTKGTGKADKKRIVFSGFGTEDTHHIVHTLRWGPDGRLYFSQSVYIHTHMETPWGVVRVNSGGVFAYDPRTERVEVVEKGLWNTWGHAWDQWGQAFYTDGAGSTGLSWGFPGATFAPNEGARRTMASISPGSYPKFAGLELIYSPHFPADWQGTAVTNDFRAHKVVHFKINDLGAVGTAADARADGTAANAAGAAGGKDVASPASPNASSSAALAATAAVNSPKSGYVTEQLPVLVQTSDATFRPIDVKLGPDGALYIADWSNPIINHGEVDFRDPRRDHEHGRIWRLSMKGGAAVKWESLIAGASKQTHIEVNGTRKELTPDEKKQNEPWIKETDSFVRGLIPKLFSPSGWERDQTRQILSSDPFNSFTLLEDGWGNSPFALVEVSWLWKRLNYSPPNLINLAQDGDSRIRAAISGVMSYWLSENNGLMAETVAFYNDAKAQTEAASKSFTDFSKYDMLMAPIHLGAFVGDILRRLAIDPSPRVRIEAMRTLCKIPHTRSASLILDAAINAPKDDPQYEFAAWLSINDLAPQVAEWVEKHAIPRNAKANIPGVEVAGKTGTVQPREDAKVAFALQSLPPDTSGPLLSRIVSARGIPRDGSGPWIELIGNTGGPGELRPLLDALLASTTGMMPLADPKPPFKTPGANTRAAAALVAAARRGVKPAGGMPPWQFYLNAPTDALPDVLRLAGLWKQNFPAAMFDALDTKASAPVLDAAFEALRTLATPEAADFLTAYFDPAMEQKLGNAALHRVIAKSDNNWRIHALHALAPLRPGEALKHLDTVLAETPEPQRVNVWRTLFAEGPFMQKFMQSIPANFPPATAATALRAARELGRRGQPLVAKLSPLAGEKAATATAPANYADLGARAKKDGDPVAGEAIYRRMASACTTCHAIGGAGGKLGPDLTSIGASAPADYIIESVLDPAAKVKEGFHAFTFKMKDGSEAIGIPSRETATEQFIRTIAGEQGLPKANIVSKKLAEGGASLMPAGLTAAWTDRERLNLYAFLMELGRPGPFDASKNNVARVWQLTDSEKVDGALKNDPTASTLSVPPIAAYTLVDGRLTKDLLAEKLAMLSPKDNTVHLTARFQAASTGRAKLNLTGIRKAWLDGQPLAIASEPSPTVELTAGAHTFTVEVDAKSPPEVLRLESPAANFLGD